MYINTVCNMYMYIYIILYMYITVYIVCMLSSRDSEGKCTYMHATALYMYILIIAA